MINMCEILQFSSHGNLLYSLRNFTYTICVFAYMTEAFLRSRQIRNIFPLWVFIIYLIIAYHDKYHSEKEGSSFKITLKSCIINFQGFSAIRFLKKPWKSLMWVVVHIQILSFVLLTCKVLLFVMLISAYNSSACS